MCFLTGTLLSGLRSAYGPVIRLSSTWYGPCTGQVGELMDGRYEVFATHGKGVFSTVLRARDRGKLDPAGQPIEVAVKVWPCH